MGIAVRCPSCRQKYLLPRDPGNKRLNCKKCGHRFLAADSPETVSQSRKARKSEEIGEVKITPPPIGKIDASDFFEPGDKLAQGDSFAPPQAATGVTPQHAGNPLMVFAVLGAVLFSLFLGVAFISLSFFVIGQNMLAKQEQEFARQEQEFARQEQQGRSENEKDLDPSLSIDSLSSADPSNQNLYQPGSQVVDFSQTNAADSLWGGVPGGLPGGGLPGGGLPGGGLPGGGLPGGGLPGSGLPGSGLPGSGLPGMGLPGGGLPIKGMRGAGERTAQRVAELTAEADKNPLQGLIGRFEVSGWGSKAIALSDTFLFVVVSDGIEVFDIQSQKKVDSIRTKLGETTYETIAVSREGDRLWAGMQSGSIDSYSVNRQGELKKTGTLNGRNVYLQRLFISPDNRRLIAAGSSVAMLWDLKKRNEITRLDLPGELVALHFQDGGEIAYGTDGQYWIAFRLTDGEVIGSGQYPFWGVQPKVFLGSHTMLAAVRGTRLTFLASDQPTPVAEIWANGMQWEMKHLEPNALISGGDNHIYRWDTLAKEIIQVWSVPDVDVQKIATSPDRSKMAVTNGLIRDIYVFDLNKK